MGIGEPILHTWRIGSLIREGDYIDLFKFGKLNYEKDLDIDYVALRDGIERLCQQYNRNYLIKESLREEME